MTDQLPDFEGASRYVMSRLTDDLSPALVYHNAFHTFDDVLPAATWLADAMQLDGDCVMLIRTAVVFHDTGFLEQVQDHESRSIALATAVLPRFGYSGEQVEIIRAIIGATRLPQRPHGIAQEIICDADLDVLGRDNFLAINRRLLEETRMLTNSPPTELEWYQGQLRFLETHRYFTREARDRRDEGKQRNVDSLRQLLANALNQSERPRPIAFDNT